MWSTLGFPGSGHSWTLGVPETGGWRSGAGAGQLARWRLERLVTCDL